MKSLGTAAALTAVLLMLGCDPVPVQTNGPPPSETTNASADVDHAAAPPAEDQVAEDVHADPPETEREVLAVGADKRGRNYGGGVITEPIKQYFGVQQRIQLMNLKRAMDLYKAGHNNKLPATHEAFMKEVVEANSLQLPELPAGERYVFDPQVGELMVERPKR